MDEYDIIIVGAGPAGLNAGIYAAEQGVNTLIIDKKQELGIPIRCAEATVETIFHDFKIKPTKETVANKVNVMKLYSSKGRKIEVAVKIQGYILNRDKFEQYLGQRAEDAGAKIQLNTTVVGLKGNAVKITEDRGETSTDLRGKIIIAADGVESRLARWVGIDTTLKPQDIAVCQQYFVKNIESDPKAVEFYWGSKYSPNGYIWVFPKSEDTANVGIVSFGSISVDLGKLLNKFLKDRAPDCEKLSFIAGCVPQAEPPAKLVKGNMMLIGDAAHVALPVTGAGIGHALRTGKWAGEIAGDVVKNNMGVSQLNEYENKVNKIRRKIKRAYKFKQKILKDDEFHELLFILAKPVPILYRIFPDLFQKFLLKNVRY
jgi:digeranylgeranylglycerophospholipid reductase